jgi:hypothetical protein
MKKKLLLLLLLLLLLCSVVKVKQPQKTISFFFFGVCARVLHQAVQDFWMTWWIEDKYAQLGTIDYFQFFGFLGLYNLIFIVLRSFTVAFGSFLGTLHSHCFFIIIIIFTF